MNVSRSITTIVLALLLRCCTALFPPFVVSPPETHVVNGSNAVFHLQNVDTQTVNLSANAGVMKLNGSSASLTVNAIKPMTITITATSTANSSDIQKKDVKIKIFNPAKINSMPELVTLGTQPGTTTVKCSYTGDEVTLEWRHVNTSQIVSNNSSLDLNNSVQANSIGKYECVVKNQLQGKEFKDTKIVTVRFKPKPPVLISADADECGPGASITWRPDPDSVGYDHRIAFVDEDNGAYENVTITTKDDGMQSEVVASLKSHTTYRVTVIDLTPGGGESVTTDLTTGVMPAPNVDANVTQSATTHVCRVSWPALSMESGIIGYQVSVSSVFRYNTSADAPSDFQYMVKEGTGYTLEPQPNREYAFSVRAENCVGMGNKSLASGACVSERDAPSMISSPTLVDDKIEGGRARVNISYANEANGAVSCYFVVLTKMDGGTVDDVRDYTIERLRNASRAPPGARDFIAVALRRGAHDDVTTVTLGNGNETWCDINDTKLYDNSSLLLNRLGGVNHPLEDDAKYRVFVVSVTPGHPGVWYVQSSSYTLLPPESSYLLLLVLLLLLFLVVIPALLFILVKVVKRRKSKRLQERDSPRISGEDSRTTGFEANGNVGNVRQTQADPRYENVRNETEKAGSSGTAVKRGPKQNDGFIGTEGGATQSTYENLRTGEEANNPYHIADRPTTTNNADDEGNIYLTATTNQETSGETLYENYRPASIIGIVAGDPVYDNVENPRKSGSLDF